MAIAPSRVFDALPEDNFGVHVENEVDARRLLWLVDKVGEEKLREAAASRHKYYPESKLFVSKLLKRFRLSVPLDGCSKHSIRRYCVYVLVLRDHSAIKVGMTGRWPERAYDFVKTAAYTRKFDDDLAHSFDMEMSAGFAVPDESAARKIEREILTVFAHSKDQTSCEREWLKYSAYAGVIDHLAALGVRISLGDSLAWGAEMRGMDATNIH